MAFTSSPRKLVPLASGDDGPSRPRTKARPTFTRRVFYCGVVVENPPPGEEYHPDVQDLLLSLGRSIEESPEDEQETADGQSSLRSSHNSPRPSSNGNRDQPSHRPTKLEEAIKELVETERSYFEKLKLLKRDYMDPLKNFAKKKETAIIDSYKAGVLFGNIDQLLPVNEAFLADLEKMNTPDKPRNPNAPSVGDVCIKHFKYRRGFENYRRYYANKADAQKMLEQEVKKSSSSGFAAYIDRIKYSNADSRNRIGLRELLMEPVQRIPRYTLMFDEIMKNMLPSDPQRRLLKEACEYAKIIAKDETDEHTRRARTMHCLQTTVEDFPATLYSNNRNFIDCIDVQDVLSYSDSPFDRDAQSLGNLHCTLFLFDDKIVIVKRPGNGEKAGRKLAGLDDLERSLKSGVPPPPLKKTGMVCKGIVDITDLAVTDVGGSDFHLFIENPPLDQSDKWSDRAFRAMTVVIPPAPINLEPSRTEAEKRRFLENLWKAQAAFRTKNGQSVAVVADETEVESKGGRVTVARTYFNLYQRTEFLQEAKKTKVVVHIDREGAADPIPFGLPGPPIVVITVQPIAGELSRYSVSSVDPSQDMEEGDIVQTARVPERIIHTIHQYGVFKFKTGNMSRPSTPSSLRSKAAIFGLDVISRNLFGALPGASKHTHVSDVFGSGGGIGNTSMGSVNPHHRRAKTTSTVSRNSVYTHSTGTTSNSNTTDLTRSTMSTMTNATSISLMDEHVGPNGSLRNRTGKEKSSSSRSRSRSLSNVGKRLLKRAKSPSAAASVSGATSGEEREHSPTTRPLSRSSQAVRDPSINGSRRSGQNIGRMAYSDYEDEDDEELDEEDAYTAHERSRGRDDPLLLQLELAKQNSQTQNASANLDVESPVEEAIYEEPPARLPYLSGHPLPPRPTSRASRDPTEMASDSQSYRSTTPTPRPRSTVPLDDTSDSEQSHRRTLSTSSRTSSERRPHGPRSPSPLPTTPRHTGGSGKSMPPLTQMSPLEHLEFSLEESTFNLVPTLNPYKHDSRQVSPLPRSKRQPFESTGNIEHTPRASTFRGVDSDVASVISTPASIEPLTIKKKSSIRTSAIPLSTRTYFSTNTSSSAKTNNHVNGNEKGKVEGDASDSSLSQPGKPFAFARGPDSPLVRAGERMNQIRRHPSTSRSSRIPIPMNSVKKVDIDKLMKLSETTKEDVESARRAIKRIKLDVEPLRSSISNRIGGSPIHEYERSPSPLKSLRAGLRPTAAPPTREAQARMEELQQMIRKRNGMESPRARPMSMFTESVSRGSESPSSSNTKIEDSARSIEDLASQVDNDLSKALETQEFVHSELKNLDAQLQDQAAELERTKVELHSAQLATDAAKTLLVDAIAEKEILFEAFNEELGNMFDDASLGGSQAWHAMVKDIERTKKDRNKLWEENTNLKRRLQEVEIQKEQWGEILRAHGLIP
ncbi:hypothetical protein C8Q75DRAFT_223510 [Abortiporus biennis]|nr:hypothetical protein C8Q75DRAFT_223510 [Abortiporus biennis]